MDGAPSPPSPPSSYLLIQNPSKSNNLGPILRCASAFAVKQVIFVGYDTCSVRGSHGASKYVQIKSFFHIEDAIRYLRDECRVVSIIGILGDVNIHTMADATVASTSTCADADADADAANHDSAGKGESGGEVDIDGNSVGQKREGAAMVAEDREMDLVKVVPSTWSGSKENGAKRIVQVSSSTSTSTSTSAYPVSYPIHTRPFPLKGNVCFSISKKSIGLPILQAKFCDFFVHVQTTLPSLSNAQYDTTCTCTNTTANSNENDAGTTPDEEEHKQLRKQNQQQQPQILYGLLDSQTCLSITLHHYNTFAKLKERNIDTEQTQKFELEKTFTQRGRMRFDQRGEDVRRRRLEKKIQNEKEIMEMNHCCTKAESTTGTATTTTTTVTSDGSEGNELLFSLFS